MASLFDSLAESVVQASFTRLLSKERRHEISLIGKAWDYYYGDQEKYIKQYRGEHDDDYIDKDKPTFNYVRRITDEYIRGVFAKPTVISLEEGKDQERWDKIVKPMTFFKIVPFFKKVQRISEISNTCVVMIRYNPITKETYFEDIRGEFVVFIPDDDNPKEIGTLVIHYEYDSGSTDIYTRLMKRVEIWNKNEWAIYTHSPYLKQTKMLDKGPNPYGFIPAAIFQPMEDDNTFYGISTINDMVKINEIYNNLWTSLARIVVMQSFSILVVTTDGELNVIVAPTRFIKFEGTEKGSSDAKYITPEPKIEEVRKVLIDLKNELQNFSQVPAEIIQQTGGSQFPQSGYALRIKRVPIENLWQDRRMSYGPSLLKLVQMSVVVDEVNNGELSERKYSEIAGSIRFTETVPGLDPQEQAIKDEQDIKYAIISPIDLMIRQRPDLTREQAKELIMKNREEMQELGVSAFGYGGEEEERSSFEEMEELKQRTNVTRQGITQKIQREREAEEQNE